MAFIGPMVVVAETPANDLLHVLGAAGAFPIIEAAWADAPSALAEIQPVALAIADAHGKPSPRHVRALSQCIESRGGPIMPVLALVERGRTPALPEALPIALDDPTDRLIARLRSALRVRSLHAGVLRRARAADANRQVAVPPNLLVQATVLCVGRGGSFPVLSVALGEQVSVIGAFSIETAARYLSAREIEGVVIGDGLGMRPVGALLTLLAEEPHLRDLPVGVLNNSGCDHELLPNLIRVESNAVELVQRVLAFVRLQAFVHHLKRMLRSLESEGGIDSQTGLLQVDTFWRDLEHAVEHAAREGGALSVARFSFDGMTDRRAHLDAARVFARLVRQIDFACWEHDGSIVAAFTETDLRSAHLIARRIASVLRQTMISPGGDRRTIKPTITLATLKPSDSMSALLARLGGSPRALAAYS
jgi:hypothetical protein